MKKLLFVTFLLISGTASADYYGSLYDPTTGNVLLLRVYQPSNQICVQVNSSNHLCWTTVNPLLLAEDNTFVLLETGGDILLEL